MRRPLFALVDCNNFFVSCLRVFQPQLNGKPVVALSSNDGCVIARSNEAKALGIPMGAPVFKWRKFFRNHGVIQMSENFELYGDMSRRITNLLTTITPHIETYSVDESFIDLTELSINDYAGWGREVSRRIMQWTGIPVSIGIAHSKTLAKLATRHAKNHPSCGGSYDLTNISAIENTKILADTAVQDVWGVGPRLAMRLRAAGILTAYDVSTLQPQYAQHMMGIYGKRLVAELNGISCLPIQKLSKPTKSISVTRTFGRDTNQLSVLEAALTTFTIKAAHTLRSNNRFAKKVGIFIATNKHHPDYVCDSAETALSNPTANTGALIDAAIKLLRQLYRSNTMYHRAGVCLSRLVTHSAFQMNIFDTIDFTKEQQLMKTIDKINQRYGKQTIRYTSELLSYRWLPKNTNKTPRYTTRWHELPKILV